MNAEKKKAFIKLRNALRQLDSCTQMSDEEYKHILEVGDKITALEDVYKNM